MSQPATINSGYLASGLPLDSDQTSKVAAVYGSSFSVDILIPNTDAEGVLYAEVCNDAFRESPAPNWLPVPGFITPVNSGIDVECFWNFERVSNKFLRIRYDYTSGGASNLLYAVLHVKSR